MKAVLDTQVFVRALINPKSRSGLLLSTYYDRFQIVLSPEVIAEILEVIFRSKLLEKYQKLREIDPEQVIALLAEAEIVEPKEKLTVCRDPDDDKFLECAVAGEASYIVSEDQDLLALRNFRGIRIVNTAAFLNILQRGG